MTVELGTKEEILMLGMINNHVLWFAIGVLSTVSFYIIWKTIRIFLASHSIAKDTNKELEESKMSEPLDQQSLAYITDCKKSLILQVKINPDWVAPLLSEIPKLVQDIARTYYPNSKNPISAPDAAPAKSLNECWSCRLTRIANFRNSLHAQDLSIVGHADPDTKI